jgi:hypothetical protein
MILITQVFFASKNTIKNIYVLKIKSQNHSKNKNKPNKKI